MQFNPSLWFICKLCRESFPDTDKLNAHKLESHLLECLNVKCIVFEEVLLNHDRYLERWIPSAANNNSLPNNNQILNIKKSNKQIIQPSKNSSSTQAERKRSPSKTVSLHNPYVSLKVLTKQELESNLNKNLKSKLAGPNQAPCSSSSRKIFSQAQILSKQNEQTGSDKNRIKSKQIPIVASDSTFLSRSRCNFQLQSDLEDASPESPSENTNDSDAEQIIETETTQFDFDDNLSIIKAEFIDFDIIGRTGTCPIETSNSETASDTNSSKNINFDMNAVLQEMPVASGASENSLRSTLKTSHSHNTRKKRAKRPKNCQCHICGRRTVSSHHLHTHMTTHSSSRRFNCRFCDASFKLGPSLQRHLIVHGKVTRHKCRFCEKFLANKRDLVGHESSHTGERPFKCDVGSCVLGFRNKSCLFRHTRNIHREELGLPDFVCHTCGMTFGLASDLKRHTRSKHEST